MAEYRKKPVVIQAVRNEGKWSPIFEWLKACAGNHFVFQPGARPPITRNANGTLNIQTLEGTMTAQVGDWIVRGINGEFYPCKPDIFEKTYECVEFDDRAAPAAEGE